MDTAVGKISVHTVNLCQILGTADRTHVHFKFLMSAVITVSKGKIYSLIISQRHGSADQSTYCFTIIIDRITYILNLTAIAELPETSLQILLFNRSYIFSHMTVETVAYIRTIRNPFHNAIHLTELFHLQST